jgi:hypothetical protein
MTKPTSIAAWRIGILLTVIVAGLLALSHTNVAYAKSDVRKGFQCQLIPADSGLPVTIMTTKTHSVVTPSGNSTLKCHFKYTGEGLPDKAVIRRNFDCGTYAGVADKSQVVISPSGKITMTCQVKHTQGGNPGAKGPQPSEMSGVVFP